MVEREADVLAISVTLLTHLGGVPEVIAAVRAIAAAGMFAFSSGGIHSTSLLTCGARSALMDTRPTPYERLILPTNSWRWRLHREWFPKTRSASCPT